MTHTISSIDRGNAARPSSAGAPVLSVIIPAYNEEATIAKLLRRLFAVEMPCGLEVVVADDASTDGTGAQVLPFVEEGRVRYVRLRKNSGKGMALRVGFAAATGDFVIVQDADEEYDPRDIPSLILPLMDGRANVVYGSRTINEHCRPHRRYTNPFWWGGRTLTWMANLMFPRCRISDEAVCYKAIRMDLLRTIPLRCRRFEFCPELTAKVSRRGEAIFNVPISYCPRDVSEGKKIRTRDWFEAVWALLRYRFSSDHGPIADFMPSLADYDAEEPFAKSAPAPSRRMAQSGADEPRVLADS